MRRQLRIVSVSFFILSSFCQCKSKADFDGQEVEFKPLNETSFVMDSIPGGTLLNLIAYSGGRKNTKDDIYYFQFIGVNKQNDDTIRILSTIISVPDEKNPANKIYSPTSQYNPEKRILSAIYYPQDSSHRTAINLSGVTAYVDNRDTNIARILSTLENAGKKNEFVVINKSIDIFQRNYKTVFGVLHFDEIPW
jgi:hypothetical protein